LLELVHFISFWTALVVSLGWAIVLARTWQVTTTIRPMPRKMPDGAVKRVSAVLAARNEAPIIERALRSLLAQEGVDMQVVAVDDGSDDGTWETIPDGFQSMGG
jgi:cellulose synthase/poly-beta-1,6-N-acetylglucosamine synthase-like glycosyltransferase